MIHCALTFNGRALIAKQKSSAMYFNKKNSVIKKDIFVHDKMCLAPNAAIDVGCIVAIPAFLIFTRLVASVSTWQ